MNITKLDNEIDLKLLERSQLDSKQVTEPVLEIIRAVRKDQDRALTYFTQKFDGTYLEEFLVPTQKIDEAIQRVEPSLLNALQKSAQNIRKFHEAQLGKEWRMQIRPGVEAGQIIRPLERVGCYIPGGRATYPSTILMTVIPARVAGVKEIICCTPPNNKGEVADVILAAAKIAGADQIYRVGGAQAIAAMAYGTSSIKAVHKIVGPGNIFVTAAKKEVYGTVDIDFPAGPSEVLVLADQTGNPHYIALDLLAQAEHDPQAASILVTNSAELAGQVKNILETELPKMERKDVIEESLKNYGKIILAQNMEQALKFTNAYAPEHLIIMTDDPEKELKKISNAGSIFLGELTPVAAGDYGSGTNHVLPTSFCAKMYSGLSTESFLKKPTVQKLSSEGLKELNETVVTLANYEGLYAHAESFQIRMKK